MSLATLVNSIQEPITYGLTQEELDELGGLMDRMEELEIYVDSPSISYKERTDATFELQHVVHQVRELAMRA